MSRTLHAPLRRSGRCRPRLERLESRLALSASPTGALLVTAYVPPISAYDGTADSLGPNLAALSTGPADGATLSSGPSTVSATFDRTLDPSFLGGNDLLVQARQGKHWVNLFTDSIPPPESLDDSGQTLTLTLPQALVPGDYRLVLPEISNLYGLDGSGVADNGADQVLAEFTVTPPGASFNDAHDLGTVFSQPIVASGALDLSTDPGAVALYKITLAPGHHWRLATEISAQRAGSLLTAQLSLFNANGTPIAVADSNRPDAPRDPYLFAGLDPGTYYLGVSGKGNVPGQAGGYDPLTGRRGSSTGAQAGGAFSLQAVADPADAATRLLSATTTFADPTDPSPSGLTLAFNGLLKTDTLRGDPTPGFRLVNQNGQVFPMTVVGFHETSARYYLLFDQHLPEGHYTVEVPPAAQGGATDLASFTPVARGEPSGVLATFNVTHNPLPRDPHDLGALYSDVHQGISRTETIPAGAAATYRFVSPTAVPLLLEMTDSAGSLRIVAIGPGLLDSYRGGAAGKPTDLNLTLVNGTYYLQFVNVGKTPTTLKFTLFEVVKWDALLSNGIGQGPALNLRMVSPSPDPSAAAPTPAGPTFSTSPTGPLSLVGSAGSDSGGAGSTSARDSTTTSALAGTANASSGLLLTVGSTLVGRPLTTTVQAVESAGAGESVTGAAGAAAVPQSYASLIPGFSWSTDDDADAISPSVQPSRPEPVNGALVAEVDAPAAAPRQGDALVTATEWLSQARDLAANWLGGRGGPAPTELGADPTAEPIVVSRDDSPAAHDDGRVEQAQLGPSFVVGITSLLTIRYHQPFRRWLGRAADEADAKSRRSAIGNSPIVRGPHARI